MSMLLLTIGLVLGLLLLTIGLVLGLLLGIKHESNVGICFLVTYILCLVICSPYFR